MDDLNGRKLQILQAIILNYLETAEPVGSRTISRRSPLGLSSATIRNEMADLEELGFIVQPHTSAGRIPSSKGYRLYVDHLLQSGRIPDEEETRVLTAMLKDKSHQLDTVLKELGEAPVGDHAISYSGDDAAAEADEAQAFAADSAGSKVGDACHRNGWQHCPESCDQGGKIIDA